jgi:hypothetical protein
LPGQKDRELEKMAFDDLGDLRQRIIEILIESREGFRINLISLVASSEDLLLYPATSSLSEGKAEISNPDNPSETW